MTDLFSWLFAPERFSPHGFCLSWEPGVLAAHIGADAAISLSYFSIALTLAAFANLRRDLTFPWIFQLIAVVFALCGVTHLFDLITVWIPLYHLQAVLKVAVGLASMVTAAGLWRLLPTALTLPSPGALRAVNERLEAEVVERRQAEADARAARERAEAGNTAKSEFLATMSHELRTPLTAILGFAGQLRQSLAAVLDDRQVRYIDIIERSGGHLLELITDILDFSRLDAGRLQLHISRTTIDDIVETSLAVVGSLATQRGLEISTDLAPALPMIEADEQRLRQVLINLLSNAIKFTPSGGSITIRAALDDSGNAVLSVTDTGIGMAPEDIPVALEKFRQIDNSLTRRYEGTGLGLPLAKALTELHGGRLEIDSAPDCGTTVSVRVPIRGVYGLPQPADGIWAPCAPAVPTTKPA